MDIKKIIKIEVNVTVDVTHNTFINNITPTEVDYDFRHELL